MKRWYVLIGAYLIMHIVVTTKYTAMIERTENDLVSWFFMLQWLVPTLMLILLVPRIQRFTDCVANRRVWTTLGLVAVVTCVALYFTSMLGRWFAWSTLGLLMLLVLFVANSQTKLKGTNAWLLGAMATFLALGSWEILYQTGLLLYHDFFGMRTMSYYVTVGEQLLWIIPALIVVLVLYRRGLHPHASRTTVVCVVTSIVCTVFWFSNGMDIPLMWWQGVDGLEGPVVNEAARPLLISISRGSQSFWLLGITTLFLRGGKQNVANR